jgi:hypothetical protein
VRHETKAPRSAATLGSMSGETLTPWCMASAAAPCTPCQSTLEKSRCSAENRTAFRGHVACHAVPKHDEDIAELACWAEAVSKVRLAHADAIAVVRAILHPMRLILQAAGYGSLNVAVARQHHQQTGCGRPQASYAITACRASPLLGLGLASDTGRTKRPLYRRSARRPPTVVVTSLQAASLAPQPLCLRCCSRHC